MVQIVKYILPPANFFLYSSYTTLHISKYVSVRVRYTFLTYLIKSFSSDKKQVAPFSLHNEVADNDRRPPCDLEAAGSAKYRLVSAEAAALLDDELPVVTGDADLNSPKWSFLLFRCGNKPTEDLLLLTSDDSDSRGLCCT